jgi:hypothetical protein
MRRTTSRASRPARSRKHGFSKATFFNRRSKYAGASVSDVERLRELEAENAKLKRMYADLALGVSKRSSAT